MAGSIDISDTFDIGDKSKINVAYVYLLFNIQFVLEKINDAHLMSRFHEWRRLLDRLYINTVILYSEKEKEQQKEEVKKVNDAFQNINTAADYFGNENKLRNSLGEYEIFLRVSANKHDMLLPKKDSRWIM